MLFDGGSLLVRHVQACYLVKHVQACLLTDCVQVCLPEEHAQAACQRNMHEPAHQLYMAEPAYKRNMCKIARVTRHAQACFFAEHLSCTARRRNGQGKMKIPCTYDLTLSVDMC